MFIAKKYSTFNEFIFFSEYSVLMSFKTFTEYPFNVRSPSAEKKIQGDLVDMLHVPVTLYSWYLKG